VVGLVLLVSASAIDFEASPLRRAVLAPLGLALGLAAMLLVFGKGPGSSGVKVNLLGFQPVEVIRLLVMLSLAAYFARRLDFLRELSEPPTASRPWLRHLRLPRWKDVRPLFVSMALLLGFFFLQKDLGPALVLSCVFLALYGIARGRSALVVTGFTLLVAGFTAAALTLVVQASVIASGLLGLAPLAGVVTPFLSYGRSSMTANCLAVGIVLSIAKRRGPVRLHLHRPIAAVAGVLAAAAAVMVGRAVWIQIVKADEIAAASSLSEQADGGVRFEYNPRLLSAARLIPR